MTGKPLDEAEARQILEDLARTGPPTAKVAAIKVLRDMDKAAKEAEEPEPSPFELAGLYEDEFSRRKALKAAERDGKGRAA